MPVYTMKSAEMFLKSAVKKDESGDTAGADRQLEKAAAIERALVDGGVDSVTINFSE